MYIYTHMNEIFTRIQHTCSHMHTHIHTNIHALKNTYTCIHIRLHFQEYQTTLSNIKPTRNTSDMRCAGQDPSLATTRSGFVWSTSCPGFVCQAGGLATILRRQAACLTERLLTSGLLDAPRSQLHFLSSNLTSEDGFGHDKTYVAYLDIG